MAPKSAEQEGRAESGEIDGACADGVFERGHCEGEAEEKIDPHGIKIAKRLKIDKKVVYAQQHDGFRQGCFGSSVWKARR